LKDCHQCKYILIFVAHLYELMYYDLPHAGFFCKLKKISRKAFFLFHYQQHPVFPEEPA